jgi:hypothetical protein
MQHRLAGRKDSACQNELANLDAEGAFNPNDGAHAKSVGSGPAEVDDYPVAGVTVIAEHCDALSEVRVDQIEIAVAAQIADRGSKANPLLV